MSVSRVWNFWPRGRVFSSACITGEDGMQGKFLESEKKKLKSCVSIFLQPNLISSLNLNLLRASLRTFITIFTALTSRKQTKHYLEYNTKIQRTLFMQALVEMYRVLVPQTSVTNNTHGSLCNMKLSAPSYVTVLFQDLINKT